MLTWSFPLAQRHTRVGHHWDLCVPPSYVWGEEGLRSEVREVCLWVSLEGRARAAAGDSPTVLEGPGTLRA